MPNGNVQATSGAPPIRSIRTSTPTLAKRFTVAVYHAQRAKPPEDFSKFNPGNSRDTLIATLTTHVLKPAINRSEFACSKSSGVN